MNKPNYTQISNDFISRMHRYKGSEVKVFIAISRKTIGWHKESDRISYSQLQELTGLSINQIKEAIKTLTADEWIVPTKTKQGYKYDLNMDLTVSEIDIAKIDTTLSKTDTPKRKTVSEIDTTKESIKETKKKETSIEYFCLHKQEFLPVRMALDDKFHNKYIEWLEYKKEKKQKLTPRTIASQLRALAKDVDPIATIDKSIRNGWQGLFPTERKEEEAIESVNTSELFGKRSMA